MQGTVLVFGVLYGFFVFVFFALVAIVVFWDAREIERQAKKMKKRSKKQLSKSRAYS
ncbi:MAG: hypothetical protein Q7R47_06820 [Candidatus Diapherotrites archaeon]|nr:hypothetical protein [Candidatus Diapherotrites archaeon]